MNECVHVLGNQLRAEAGSGTAYRDDQLVLSLIEQGESAGHGAAVRSALERAIEANSIR